MQLPLTSDPWIGRLLGERQRYRIEKRLGVGGMGYVFLAMDTLLGQQVALKLLKDTLIASEELRKRFEREAALCGALRSNHIVQVNDYGVTPEGYPFYVMEYLQGQTLGELLRQQRQLSIERTASIVIQVCEGLCLAHKGVALWRDGATAYERVKVVHRDLKPDNIFLVPTPLGELVKVLDFGIAKIRDDGTEYNTLTKMFMGTYRYAAPEQLEGEKDLDGRADIYSLGIIMYEMLSGTDPFGLSRHRINGMSWALAHTTKPPIPLRLQPGLEHLSSALEAVVMRCLRKVPDERFSTVDELKRELLTAAAISQQSISIPKTTTSLQLTTLGCPSELSTLIKTDPQKIDSLPSTQLDAAFPSWNSRSDRRSSNPRLPQKATLLLTGAGIAIAMAVAAISYPYLNLHSPVIGNSNLPVQDPESLARSHLERAKQLAVGNKFADAIATASSIPKKSNFYATARASIAQWSDIILLLATAQYQTGKLDAAIAQARAIPINVAPYQKARAAVVQWTKDWQVAETQFRTARAALNAGHWQAAIDASNKVPNISYWQQKIKPIIQSALSEIAKTQVPPKVIAPLQQITVANRKPVEKPSARVLTDRSTTSPPSEQPATPTTTKDSSIQPLPVDPSGKGWEDNPGDNSQSNGDI